MDVEANTFGWITLPYRPWHPSLLREHRKIPKMVHELRNCSCFTFIQKLVVCHITPATWVR